MDNIIKGTVSGYIGAITVYPIDLIKTRLQNNKYSSTLHCLKTIIKNEGYRVFYKGLLVQIIGVGPEKAIKITTNEIISNYLLDSKINKIIAGACAGASQVIVTNPIEIIKIKYQINSNKSNSLLSTIKEIGGFKNLYKGATACLLRDVPFSAIYFPSYDSFKSKTDNYFLSGMLAAIPAAYLVTPADVIKTRFQIGNNYNNIVECAIDLYKKEGFLTFWRGGLMRILKSSPQFGITLYIYEKL